MTVILGRPHTTPLTRTDDRTWIQVINLFRKHGMPEPTTELRDELVMALEWAWYGQALDACTPPPSPHVVPSEAELMRQKAISNARERNAAERAVQAALDDFELTVERIDAGQIDRARGTAFQGAKEARRFLATATEASDE